MTIITATSRWSLGYSGARHGDANHSTRGGVLAKHYGFTDEELDFIINCDIKYRMGQDSEEAGGE